MLYLHVFYTEWSTICKSNVLTCWFKIKITIVYNYVLIVDFSYIIVTIFYFYPSKWKMIFQFFPTLVFVFKRTILRLRFDAIRVFIRIPVVYRSPRAI